MRAKALNIHADWNLAGNNNALLSGQNTDMGNQKNNALWSGQTQTWPIIAKAPHIHADGRSDLVGDRKNNALLSEWRIRTNAPHIHTYWTLGDDQKNNTALLSGQNTVITSQSKGDLVQVF